MQEFKLVMEKASGELEEILVPEGTTFEEIAKSYQEDYKDLIVLACVDGKLRELNKEIKKDCSVKFLTSISRDGKRTYRRSMTLLMQKAIENLWGEQAHVRLLYSLGEGYYCRMEDGTDATKLAQIKAEMLRLVHENLPIRKCSVKTGDAERIFREKGMKDKERLLHAVTVANIRDFIDSLPLGYNTKIGMEGNGVSQGQRQRILIARAVYKNPDFIFLDEATNALDANNEREIMEQLHAFYKGRTVVVVAHRLSTVRDADKIVVLDKGRIVEEGTHQELTALRGTYYKLVKNQLELGN